MRSGELCHPGPGAAASLPGGCVYYNGMYNANRLANSARKAERDGRTFEANNLWGQVATKAESVVVRHPRSKYAEEAAILRGLALARMGQCEQALRCLEPDRGGRREPGTDRRRLAGIGPMPGHTGKHCRGRRGVCRGDRQQGLRSPAGGALSARADPAIPGRYDESIRSLEGNASREPSAERLLSLAGAGRLPTPWRWPIRWSLGATPPSPGTPWSLRWRSRIHGAPLSWWIGCVGSRTGRPRPGHAGCSRTVSASLRSTPPGPRPGFARRSL